MNRTGREKVVIASLAAAIVAILALFFAWYDKHHDVQAPRASPADGLSR